MRTPTRQLLVVAMVAALAVVVAPAAAHAGGCTATVDKPSVTFGTPQKITVTGLTPGESVSNTQTHNGQTFHGGGTVPSNPWVFSLTYALGTWSDTFHGNTSGLTCNTVSWTVGAATTQG